MKLFPVYHCQCHQQQEINLLEKKKKEKNVFVGLLRKRRERCPGIASPYEYLSTSKSGLTMDSTLPPPPPPPPPPPLFRGMLLERIS
ncbi:hypothetical protein E2C01_093584 [Portunus trituberculatus]|uniref:Uncharacterized protein n=1 Tax=Portunus trituberculatus TaxID=210409 RepID=A0A5B7JV73_PORTR|nr:hypothetical protein [Portunus trituberculatus]